MQTEYCDHHTVANICTASGMLAGSYCPADTITTGVYVIGGSANTEDGPYLLTDEFLSQTCTVHNESNSSYTGSFSFPSLGINPISPDAGSGTSDNNNDNHNDANSGNGDANTGISQGSDTSSGTDSTGAGDSITSDGTGTSGGDHSSGSTTGSGDGTTVTP